METDEKDLEANRTGEPRDAAVRGDKNNLATRNLTHCNFVVEVRSNRITDSAGLLAAPDSVAFKGGTGIENSN